MAAHKKINQLRIVILSVIGAFVIAISTTIYINAKLKNLVKTPTAIVKLSKNIPDLRLKNVHYEKTKEGGEIEWEINAKVAHHFEGKDLLTLDGVKMFYYESKKRTILITGRQGRVKPSTKDIELLGDVFIKSSDGYKLRTNSLKYLSKSSLIYTQDRVSIEGNKFKIKGVGMKMNVNEDKLSILHAVQTTIRGKSIKGSIPALGF